MWKIWKPVLLLVLMTALLLGTVVWLSFHSSRRELLRRNETVSAAAGSAASEKPMPPAQATLTDASLPVTAEETNEKEENARAQKLLTSNDDKQRIEGLELLGAYPSSANEVILVRYLKSRENSEIRSTAAISLSTLENPMTPTIDALLDTLADSSEDVRFSALSTLEDYLTMKEKNSSIYRHMQAGFRSKLQSQRLQADIAKDIDEIVHDR
jgi:HEAT repeat protein